LWAVRRVTAVNRDFHAVLFFELEGSMISIL